MSETITEDIKESSVSQEDIERMLAASRRVPDLEHRLSETQTQLRRTERERDEAAGAVKTEAELRYQAETAAAVGAIDAARAQADAAEDAIAAAHEAGDARALAKAQRLMSEATTKLDRFESRKEWLEANKGQFVREQPAKTEPQGQAGSDEYDRLVDGVLPSEKQWLKTRPQFLTDARYRNKVFGASTIAVADGHERGSEAYFTRISEILGETRREAERDEPAARERPMSADVAPARRASPGANPQGSRQFTLSADEQEVADSMYGNPNSDDYIADMGARYKRYHDNKQRLRDAGRL